MRTATLTIRHSALDHNVQSLRSRLMPSTKLLAMVKANAYGHGNLALDGLMGADGFGVATFEEGMAVYQHCQQRHQNKLIVLMEGVFSEDEWEQTIQYGFSTVIHHKQQLDWALTTPPNAKTYPPNSRLIWLKYNTGMSRLGFDTQHVPSVAKALHDKGYELILTSHFACADDIAHPLNAKQITKFNEMLCLLQTTICPTIKGSLCNSAGIINFPHAHHDWVRAGIALYGASPVANKTAKALNLQPVMSFCAKIMAIHELNQGDSVGYGGLWTADKYARIGVISIGYGDGYPRVVKGAWLMVIKDNQSYPAPIIGRVAMDMMMIDLTHLPYTIDVDDDVVLWGDSPSVDEIATCAGTISYELFCRTTARPTRVLID